jgi:uncharacterized protein (DUF3084 family)
MTSRTTELRSLRQDLATLKTNYEAQLARTKEVETALTGARGDIDKLNQELISTNSLLRDTQAQNTRLEQLARRRIEQVQELQDEIDRLRTQVASGGGAGAGTAAVAPTSPDQLVGTITAVRGDYASINIGSAQGIQQGMRLVIYRGGDFVADIRVDEVELQQAAGVILDRRLDPMQGDKVTNRLNP